MDGIFIEIDPHNDTTGGKAVVVIGDYVLAAGMQQVKRLQTQNSTDTEQMYRCLLISLNKLAFSLSDSQTKRLTIKQLRISKQTLRRLAEKGARSVPAKGRKNTVKHLRWELSS